jgi:hypothetical protein
LSTRRQTKRQRRQAREQAHDLRQRYNAADLPLYNSVAVDEIEDPYSPAARIGTDGNLAVEARLEQARHSDGSIAEGAPGWTPPERPMVTVVRALRDDPLGRMHSRRQIDRPQFMGGRAYQETADRATLGAVRSIDLTKTRVSGGRGPDMLTEEHQKAMQRLRHVEQRVAHRYGLEGLSLCRAVLSERQSVEASARLRGAASDREVWFWARLFRKCLDVLAVASDLMTLFRS